jgi:acetamidase/formamidase
MYPKQDWVKYLMRRIEKKPEDELNALLDSVLDPRTPPIAKVQPGEIIEIETWSALAKVINPTTGPIYIEGSEPGDTLEVEILNIDLPSEGTVGIIPGFGSLEGWLNLMEPRRKICSINNSKIIYVRDDGKEIELTADPFIGTIGVAPEFEAVSSLSPGRHGGNMDCPDIRPGNTLLLPVRWPGALFKLGDVHAVQGDGEVCGVAVEVNAVVTIKFKLRKNWTINWPRIESKEEIMTIGSARPLEDAARHAFKEMVEWMVADYGWDRDDAYMFLSLAGKARIAQIVDPLYTVVAKLHKRYLELN